MDAEEDDIAARHYLPRSLFRQEDRQNSSQSDSSKSQSNTSSSFNSFHSSCWIPNLIEQTNHLDTPAPDVSNP